MPSNSQKDKKNEKSNKELVDSYKSFIRDFAKESDRAAIVLGAAKLDTLLRQLLQRSLRPCTSSTDDLLDSERPLGTFSARIDVCYRLGLIDSELTRALHLIRRIRNEVAHEVSSVSLMSGPHSDRIRELVSPMKNLEIFEKFKKRKEFAHTSSAAKDFRVVLAMVCGRGRMMV